MIYKKRGAWFFVDTNGRKFKFTGPDAEERALERSKMQVIEFSACHGFSYAEIELDEEKLNE